MYSPNKMEPPQKQDEHDNDGEVASPPLKKMGDNISEPNLKNNEDLLGVLGNDVVLGEVMTRLPWCNRPVLKMLSRSWAHAFTHSFPPYARRHHPRILSKLIVLFRSPFPNYPSDSEDDLALWLYSCDRPLMWNLPVPQIPVHLHKHVKFLCDDNDECIYSICVLEKGLYDVHVLDLREGICSGWKRLPSLPVDIDNYVYSCSSTSILNGNGSTSTAHTISMRKTIEAADPNAFSHWTLTDSEDKWECQRVSSKPLAFDAEEEKPPFYVEIERHSDTYSRPLKCLFQRCERLDDSEPPALLWGNRYIIMFQEDTAVSRGYNFYEIRIYNDSVELHRMKLKESSRRIPEDEEGLRFWDFWLPRIGIHGFNLPEEGTERSVIKVSEERVEMRVEGHGNHYVQVAQRSRSLYLYRLTGSYYDDQN